MGNNISDIIRNRRATPPRFFRGDKIEREVIELLLENGSWAPTHKQTEPWRFKVYLGDSKDNLAGRIFEMLKQNQVFYASVNMQKAEKFTEGMNKVPVAIAIILQRDEAERIPEWEETAAIAMAVQNMWLTATELGLGGFWATPEFLPLVGNLIGILPSQKLLGFFYVGKVGVELPSPGREDVALKTEWFD